MAAYELPKTAVETQRLRSTLLKFGVSSAGADQFARGQPVALQADRQAIASLFGQLVRNASTLDPLKGRAAIDTHIK